MKKNPRAEAKAKFANVLTLHLSVRDMTQVELARALNVTQSTVSAWMRGRTEPAKEEVFAAERALDLAPGGLSWALGYLPLDAVGPEYLRRLDHEWEVERLMSEAGLRMPCRLYDQAHAPSQ